MTAVVNFLKMQFREPRNKTIRNGLQYGKNYIKMNFRKSYEKIIEKLMNSKAF